MNKNNKTRLKNILILFDLFGRVNQKDTDYIKRLYIQYTEGFEDCVDFILKLNLIKTDKGRIEISEQLTKFLLKKPSEYEISEFVLQKLLNNRDNNVWEYLEKFTIRGSKYIFEPLNLENLRFSNIRNLLIELGFIIYNSGRNNYEINEKHVPLFIDVVCDHSIHPQKLKKIIEDREIIGNLAELAIVDFEKKRLGFNKELLSAIVHKSLEDSSAGYDIKSITLDDNFIASERFIEVKAISSSEMKFYFTRNEFETSKKHRSNYYLYLLPVSGKNKFDLDNLEIIQDPSNKIFNSQYWEIECEQFFIKRESTE